MHNNIMAAVQKSRPPMSLDKEDILKCVRGDEIYSTVDACNTAKEMWTAIERLQQGESLNVQDQFQNEVNDIRSERLSRSAKSDTLLARLLKPYSITILSGINQNLKASMNHHTAILPFHSRSNDPEQARRDKDMQKNLALLAKLINMRLECVDERAALANLIANLTLDTEENKMVLKQLKKANASLTQELKECKTNLDESSRALGEATSSRDSCLIALQTKKTREL
ncbi:hypothetical protein Tco_1193508 [Tanacetum coccineum]